MAKVSNIFYSTTKDNASDFESIDVTNEAYYKIAFIEDTDSDKGRCIATHGVLFKNLKYWLKVVDAIPETQEADTIYWTVENTLSEIAWEGGGEAELTLTDDTTSEVTVAEWTGGGEATAEVQ